MFLLANVVDDADMGITHVIRGEDHVNGTPKYLLLRRGARPRRPPGVRPPAAARERAAQEAVEAPRRRVGRRLQGARATCPRRCSTTWRCSAGARPTASRSADRRDRRAVPARGRQPVARASSTSRSSSTSTASGSGRSTLDEFVARAAAVPRRATRAGDALARARSARAGAGRRCSTSCPRTSTGSTVRPTTERSWDKAMKLPVAGDVLDGIVGAYDDVPWEPTSCTRGSWRWPNGSRSSPSKVQGPIRVAVTGARRAAAVRVLEYLGRDESSRGCGRRGRACSSRRASARRRLARHRRPRSCRRRARSSSCTSSSRSCRCGGVAPGRRPPGAGDHRARRRAVRRPPVAGARGSPRPCRRALPRRLAPVIVVTGGGQPGDRFTEAAASANYLAGKGVPGDAIERETTSTNSYDELAAAARFLHDAGDQRRRARVGSASTPTASTSSPTRSGLNGARVADADEPGVGVRTKSRRCRARRSRSGWDGSSATTASTAGSAANVPPTPVLLLTCGGGWRRRPCWRWVHRGGLRRSRLLTAEASEPQPPTRALASSAAVGRAATNIRTSCRSVAHRMGSRSVAAP